MNRYEIEDAVERSKQFLHTIRGVQGLVGVCELVLNSTKELANLDERKVELENKIAGLVAEYAANLDAGKQQEGQRMQEHEKRMNAYRALEHEWKQKVEQAEKDFFEKKHKLERALAKSEEAHTLTMERYRTQQEAEAASLTSITAQIEAIKSRLG